jgi:hypothetical protein
MNRPTTEQIWQGDRGSVTVFDVSQGVISPPSYGVVWRVRPWDDDGLCEEDVPIFPIYLSGRELVHFCDVKKTWVIFRSEGRIYCHELGAFLKEFTRKS